MFYSTNFYFFKVISVLTKIKVIDDSAGFRLCDADFFCKLRCTETVVIEFIHPTHCNNCTPFIFFQ